MSDISYECYKQRLDCLNEINKDLDAQLKELASKVFSLKLSDEDALNKLKSDLISKGLWQPKQRLGFSFNHR